MLINHEPIGAQCNAKACNSGVAYGASFQHSIVRTAIHTCTRCAFSGSLRCLAGVAPEGKCKILFHSCAGNRRDLQLVRGPIKAISLIGNPIAVGS